MPRNGTLLTHLVEVRADQAADAHRVAVLERHLGRRLARSDDRDRGAARAAEARRALVLAHLGRQRELDEAARVHLRRHLEDDADVLVGEPGDLERARLLVEGVVRDRVLLADVDLSLGVVERHDRGVRDDLRVVELLERGQDELELVGREHGREHVVRRRPRLMRLREGVRGVDPVGDRCCRACSRAMPVVPVVEVLVTTPLADVTSTCCSSRCSASSMLVVRVGARPCRCSSPLVLVARPSRTCSCTCRARLSPGVAVTVNPLSELQLTPMFLMSLFEISTNFDSIITWSVGRSSCSMTGLDALHARGALGDDEAVRARVDDDLAAGRRRPRARRASAGSRRPWRS